MQAQPPPLPNLQEVAKDLAQLQDFRLLFYVLIVVLVLALVERWWSGHAMRREREQLMGMLQAERKEMKEERFEMWKVADKFTEAAKSVGDSADKLVIELQVLRALTARVEQRPSDGER